MPKYNYKIIGSVYEGRFGGYNIKLDFSDLPEDGRLYIQPPHPDYIDEKSPLFFIKRKDGEVENKHDEPSFGFGISNESDVGDDIP